MTVTPRVYRVEHERQVCGCGDCPIGHPCEASLAVFDTRGDVPWVVGATAYMNLIPDFELCDCPGGRATAMGIARA